MPRERGDKIPSVWIALSQGAALLNEIFQGDTTNKVDQTGASLIQTGWGLDPQLPVPFSNPICLKGSVEPPGVFRGTKFENQRCCLGPLPVLPWRDRKLEIRRGRGQSLNAGWPWPSPLLSRGLRAGSLLVHVG